MGQRVYRDIEIRGVVYPTAQDAAQAIGVNECTVLRAIRLGRLDRVGLGRIGSVPLPVRIRGVTYPSARDAARKLGVKVNTIYAAIEAGREDRVGLPRKATGKSLKPVRIGPFSFPSHAEGSRALGFKATYISHSLRKGRASSMERIIAAAMKLEERQRRERMKWDEAA